jgi:hypothetical protein
MSHRNGQTATGHPNPDIRLLTDRVRLTRLGVGYYRLEIYLPEDDVWTLSTRLDGCDTDTAEALAELLDESLQTAA